MPQTLVKKFTTINITWRQVGCDRQNQRKKGCNNTLTITDTQRALIRLLIPHTPNPPVKYHCSARPWDHNVLTPAIWMKEPSLHTEKSRTGPKEIPQTTHTGHHPFQHSTHWTLRYFSQPTSTQNQININTKKPVNTTWGEPKRLERCSMKINIFLDPHAHFWKIATRLDVLWQPKLGADPSWFDHRQDNVSCVRSFQLQCVKC